MTTCAKYKKRLSLLAIGAAEAREAEELRAHLKECAGCRDYFAGISKVAGTFAEAGSAAADAKIEATEMFHRKLTHRIEAEEGGGFWRSLRRNWRMAAVMAGSAVVVVALFLISQPGVAPQPVAPKIQAIASVTKSPAEREPTLGSYRMLADRSLDVLDQELTAEARIGVARAQVYRVSSLTGAAAAD